MKIRQVSCDQFAGMQGKNLTFADGLNLVVGKNESGKSTIAELIFQLLFKDSKLDLRKDSDFLDRYFPKKSSGPRGDVIDGTLLFETEQGTFRLEKEWDAGKGNIRLHLPDGTVLKGKDAIRDTLSEELKGRAGLYSEIVFMTQKRDAMATESIMKALSGKASALSATRADLLSALTQASLETGGVSLEKIEQALRERITALSSHWDLSADLPEGGAKRGIGNEWQKNVGEILASYYAMERIRKIQSDAEEAEKKTEALKAERKLLSEDREAKETEKETFQKYSGMLEQRALLVRAEADLKDRIGEETEALSKWPGLKTDKKKAEELLEKQNQAAVRRKYREAEEARRAYEEKTEELGQMKKADPADIKNLRERIAEKKTAEGKFKGLNLTAKIKTEKEGIKAEVRRAAGGEMIEEKDGGYRITEAADILVPGVLSISLLPSGIDTEQVKGEIEEAERAISEIAKRYGTADPEALEELSEQYRRAEQEAESLRLSFEHALDGHDFAELEEENRRIPAELEEENEIQEAMEALCGRRSAEAFMGAAEQLLEDYATRFVSEEELSNKLRKQQEELAENKRKQDVIRGIPEAYQKIEDPEAYAAELDAQIRVLKEKVETLDGDLKAAEKELKEKSAEEYSEELLEKEAAFREKKEEFRHWQHINDVFLALKEETAGNPAEDIEKNFRENLQVISGGADMLDGMDAELSASLKSKGNALTYETLSDGTKDTISLAFRLAMLQHLYPEGGGLAVFDDPFTDMDPERVAQACELLRKFAEKNQVIFLTCDEKYVGLLPGTVLSMDE